MADIIVVQIQNIRGERKDLPQSLAPGEIGFCTDTSQIFVGADGLDDPNSVVTLTAQLYDSNDITLANTYLASHILIIDPADPNIPFDPNTILADTGGDYYCITSRKILTDPTNIKSGKAIERAYIGYIASQVSKPAAGLGPERWANEVTTFVGTNDFFNPLLGAGDVPDPNVDEFFTSGDSGCISELLNKVHGGFGLVNTLQNIEIQRVSSRIPLAPPTSIAIDTIDTAIITFNYPPITGVTIDYSVFSEAGNYSRTGRIKVSTADITAFTDTYVDSFGTTDAELYFTAETTGAGPSTVVVKANANNFLDSEMSYRIIRWDSVQGAALTPSITSLIETVAGNCNYALPAIDCVAVGTYEVTFVPNDIPGNMSVVWGTTAGALSNQVDDFVLNKSTIDVTTTSGADVLFDLTATVNNAEGSDIQLEPFTQVHGPVPPVLASITISDDQQIICNVLGEVDVVLRDQFGDPIDPAPYTITWSFVSGDAVTITSPNTVATGLILEPQGGLTFFQTTLKVVVDDPVEIATFEEQTTILRIPQSRSAVGVSSSTSVYNTRIGGTGTPLTNITLQPAYLLATDYLLDGAGNPIINTGPCAHPDPNFEQMFWNWPTAVANSDPADVGFLGTNVYRVDGNIFTLIEFIPGKTRNYSTLPVSPSAHYTISSVWRQSGLGAAKEHFSNTIIVIGKINKVATVVSDRGVAVSSTDMSFLNRNITRTTITSVLVTDTSGVGTLLSDAISIVSKNETRFTIEAIQGSDVSGAGSLIGENASLTGLNITRLNGTNIG